MPPPLLACRHTFLHDLLPAPPSGRDPVTAESEPRLPARAGARAEAHPAAPVGAGDELCRLSPRAVAAQRREVRPGVTNDPPIHAYRRGGGAAMMAS